MESGTGVSEAAGDRVFVGSGTLFGYNLLTVAVEPSRIEEGTLQVLCGMRLKVECEPGPVELVVRRRGEVTDRVFEHIMSQALGVDVSGSGTWDVTGASGWVSRAPSLDGSAVDCVIITGDDLAAEFERPACWHDLMGIGTLVKTVDWIESRYPGSDAPERIRSVIYHTFEEAMIALIEDLRDDVPT